MYDPQELMHQPLVLCRGWSVHAPSPAEVQIRSGVLSGQAYSLPDPTRSGRLAALLAALDGSRTPAELLQDWPKPAQAAVLKLLVSLAEVGVVAPATGEAASWFEQGLQAYKLHRQALAQVTDAHLLILGAGVLGSRVAVNAALAGIRRISVWDPAPLTAADCALNPTYRHCQPGSDRGRALVTHLSSLAPSIQAEAVPDLDAAMGDCTLAVLAQDYLDPALCDRVNALALRHGRRWTLLTMDGPQGMVGPTIVPRQTACYACLEAYWTGLRRSPAEVHGLFSRLRTAPRPGGYHGIPAFADVVAGLFVSDLPNILLQAPAFTLGQMLAVHFPSFVSTVHQIPRVPRCPACYAASRPAPTPEQERREAGPRDEPSHPV